MPVFRTTADQVRTGDLVRLAVGAAYLECVGSRRETHTGTPCVVIRVRVPEQGGDHTDDHYVTPDHTVWIWRDE